MVIPVMTTKEQIRRRAAELGFTHVGFAEAEGLDPERSRLREWLDRGLHGSMSWMRRTEETRGDPRRLLPGARTVIALAVNYYTGHRYEGVMGTGKVSRYAWGGDYHEIVGEKLGHLLAWMMEQFPGSKAVSSVDAGPVMDKVWAQRAGVGWIGKHTNVITRDHGSWVFLGEIITTLEIAPDLSATDHCGTCTRCIDACPTHAIIEPSVVDSHLCLSYLTIEHRGPVDPHLHSAFDGWLFGCDVCQDVCPWNVKFSQESPEPGFHPREGHREPGLEEWRTMSQEQFSTRFRASPIKRAKYEGLMRTIDILLSPAPARP